jgi:hypothetical protein
MGQLNETQLTSLLPQRQEITPAQLELGSKAWRAYSAPDALQLISLMGSDLSALHFCETHSQNTCCGFLQLGTVWAESKTLA